MSSSDNNLVITFNGEIYNFKGLKKDLIKKGHKFNSESDTEVIIKGYEEYGENICSKLDGMFAFVIWDKKNKDLFLARDKFGKKPLYYSIQKENIIFASEIKALLKAGVQNKVDKNMLLDTIMCRFSPGKDTVFSEIKKLPPSSFAVFSQGKIKISSYYSLPNISEKINPKIEEVDNLIDGAVQKRLVSDVPVGVLLSGGLDSSAIVSYMSRVTDKIKTFSVGFKEGIDESKYARVVSEHFQTDHKEIILDGEILSYLPKVVWHMDEPLSDPASLPTYLLAREVSKHVKVALSGEGGDEVFGGYDTVNRLSFVEKVNKIPRPLKNISSHILKGMSTFYKYPKKQIYNFGADLLNSKEIEKAYKKLYYFPFNSNEIKYFVGVQRPDLLDKYLEKNLYKTSINFYFKEWLPNDLLMKVDKMSMAHGLEVRAPFLDKDLIKYFFEIPLKYKTNKFLFRKTISKQLPKVILNRKKQGFSLPISTWFTNKDFFNRVNPHIEDLKERDIFNKSKLDSLISKPTTYRNDHKLWTLLNVELWHKLYIDNITLEKVEV